MHCGDPSSPSPKTFLSRWRQLAEKQRKAPLHSPPRNSSPESGSRSAIFVMGKACWKGSDQNHLCCGQARAMEEDSFHICGDTQESAASQLLGFVTFLFYKKEQAFRHESIQHTHELYVWKTPGIQDI
ncbi:Serine/Threonine-Protein Kinase Ulk1 [Manis pentadactyla]|nr:Serine/Threonine-Protein Kinase Ulk1 [Manis pentadactyla]